MSPTAYTLGVPFTADENSLERIALGGTVNLDKFTDARYGTAGSKVIPAGTLVIRDTDNRLIPFTGTPTAGNVFIMASDVVEGTINRNARLTTGLYAGGVFYEDKLPDATAGTLTAAMKTGLGPKFTFQKSQGSLVITQ